MVSFKTIICLFVCLFFKDWHISKWWVSKQNDYWHICLFYLSVCVFDPPTPPPHPHPGPPYTSSEMQGCLKVMAACDSIHAVMLAQPPVIVCQCTVLLSSSHIHITHVKTWWWRCSVWSSSPLAEASGPLISWRSCTSVCLLWNSCPCRWRRAHRGRCVHSDTELGVHPETVER